MSLGEVTSQQSIFLGDGGDHTLGGVDETDPK